MAVAEGVVLTEDLWNQIVLLRAMWGRGTGGWKNSSVSLCSWLQGTSTAKPR